VDNFNYQQNAFEKLDKLKGGILFMSMGTGKTKVAVDLAISKQDKFDIVLWIAPASLICEDNYKAEIDKWGNNLKKPIKYFSIEGVGSSENNFLNLINLATNNKTFCIIDESITIKNMIAKRTKRLIENWHLFTFRLILNGTPLTNSLLDLYSQINFIHPSILKMTESQFANNFLCFKKDSYRSYAKSNKPANQEALIEIIRPYIFDTALLIDKKIYNKEFIVKMSIFEKFNYENFKNNIINSSEQIMDFLGIAQKLQNFYSNNCEEKFVKLKEIAENILAKGEKVIIYVKFLSELEKLKELFKDAVEYSGKDKSGISKFKKDANILISTYGTGSLGHNLQFCNNIIYFTQTFNYKDKEQSLHRIYRVGQKKDCNIYNFYINTGLDKLIENNLIKKTNLLFDVKKIISQNNLKNL